MRTLVSRQHGLSSLTHCVNQEQRTNHQPLTNLTDWLNCDNLSPGSLYRSDSTSSWTKWLRKVRRCGPPPTCRLTWVQKMPLWRLVSSHVALWTPWRRVRFRGWWDVGSSIIPPTAWIISFGGWNPNSPRMPPSPSRKYQKRICSSFFFWLMLIQGFSVLIYFFYVIHLF